MAKLGILCGLGEKPSLSEIVAEYVTIRPFTAALAFTVATRPKKVCVD